MGEGVELRFDRQVGAAHAAVESMQLEQMVLNLVVNARDALADGGVVTSGVCERSVGPEGFESPGDLALGRYVALSVSDDGHGMPPEVLTRIFQPFYTTKGGGRGHGIGLATVLSNVRASSGSVGVQSAVGRGTTFTVALPAATQPRTFQRHKS